MISVQVDAKTKVSVGAGKVVGGTNAAAGIYANINYKRALHQCCYHISDLQSSSMRFLKDKHQPSYHFFWYEVLRPSQQLWSYWDSQFT